MSAQTIPVLDLNDYRGGDPAGRQRFVQGLGQALEEVGFFALTGHGILDAEVERIYALAGRVFALPAATKRRHEEPALMGQRGYVSFGREHAKDQEAPDLKEYWSTGPELPGERTGYPPNRWPEEVPEFRSAVLSMFAALEGCAMQLLEACSSYLGEAPGLLPGLAREGDSLLRVLHYPPIPPDAPPQAVRSAAHEDINLITLLCGASADGLEIQRRDGSWLAVRAIPGQVIVDAGDMLQHLTNGVFRSTTHRVVNPDQSRERRYSMPFFVHPRPDVDLSPLASCVARAGRQERFGPLTAGAFLRQRLGELGLAKG